MGRKTWDSIPPKFRPLKGRNNIVVSRSPITDSSEEGKASTSSLQGAIEEAKGGGRAFVIGGAQIYKAALERKETKRILLTRILSDFECDTFFPVVLGEDGQAEGWVRRREFRSRVRARGISLRCGRGVRDSMNFCKQLLSLRLG
jgi:dihydrofolate reductase